LHKANCAMLRTHTVRAPEGPKKVTGFFTTKVKCQFTLQFVSFLYT
jgi:hypothetical protein